MTSDERLAIVETKVAEQTKNWEALSAKMDSQFAALNEKIDRLLEAVSNKIDRQGELFGEKVDKQAGDFKTDIAVLTKKSHDDFKWLVGINVTMWATTVGALIVIAGLILSR